MFRKYLARLTLLFLLLFSSVAFATGPYSQLFVFSDSLSDNGNAASLVPPELWPPDPPYYGQTRATNGPVAVEALAATLGLSAETSLHLIGPAVGTNYAVAGAKAGGFEPPDLVHQVAAYLINVGGVADPDALYVLFIGGNDVRSARDSSNIFTAWRTVRLGALLETSAIRALAAAGARNFLLVNVTDIGIIPETRRLAQETGNSHLPEIATFLTRVYNRELAKRTQLIRKRLGVNIVEFDLFTTLHTWIANADVLGFTNTQDSCLATFPFGECNPATINNFLFFDEIHPTASVHQLLGDALADSLPHTSTVSATP